MHSLSVSEIKPIGYSFSAGLLLMWEAVDKEVGITEFIRQSGLKVRGVPLSELVKTLILGTMDHKKSILAIWGYAQAALAKYIGNGVEEANLRNFYRAVEKLGFGGKELYRKMVDRFLQKYKIDISQLNLDWSSSYFTGTKCSLAELGYSRDHRPDKPQIKLGFAQINDIKIAFDFFDNSGNIPDVSEFRPTYLKIAERIPKGTLIVYDKGGSSEENNKLVAGTGNYYLTAHKMTGKIRYEILSLDKSKLTKAKEGYLCQKIKTENGYDYFFWSGKLAKHAKERRVRRVKEMIAKARERQEEIKKKGFRTKTRQKTKLYVEQLEDRLITTTITSQIRLTTKPIEKIEQELLEEKAEFDGWFVLTSNKDLTPVKALKAYRDKDSVEKIISVIKGQCKLRPFNVRKDASVRGSLFISVLASFVLGVFQYINKASLKNTSAKTLLNRLSCLTVCFDLSRFGKVVRQTLSNWGDFFAKLFGQPQQS